MRFLEIQMRIVLAQFKCWGNVESWRMEVQPGRQHHATTSFWCFPSWRAVAQGGAQTNHLHWTWKNTGKAQGGLVQWGISKYFFISASLIYLMVFLQGTFAGQCQPGLRATGFCSGAACAVQSWDHSPIQRGCLATESGQCHRCLMNLEQCTYTFDTLLRGRGDFKTLQDRRNKKGQKRIEAGLLYCCLFCVTTRRPCFLLLCVY